MLRNQRAYVDEPQRAWRVTLVTIAMLALGVAAIAGVTYLPDGNPVATVSAGVLGGFVGVASASAAVRASAYRSGYMRGRLDMLSSLLARGVWRRDDQ